MKELIGILKAEEDAFRNLLNLLDKQFRLIINKDIFALESLVEEIQAGNKKIAEEEVKRRRITGNDSMSQIIDREKSEELENVFRDLKKIIEEVRLQKETNELLLKQEISFNAKILNIINPRRETSTYNAYGNIRR